MSIHLQCRWQQNSTGVFGDNPWPCKFWGRVAYLSQLFIRNEQFFCEERKIAEPLRGFPDCSMLDTGEAWVAKIHIHGDGFGITISHVEIVNIVEKHDLIIPETWIMKYKQDFWSMERKRLADKCFRSSKYYRWNSERMSTDYGTQATTAKYTRIEGRLYD